MSENARAKITVLKVFDPKDVFEESPVKMSGPRVPCSIHHEGQEFIVENDMKMPGGFCHWAWNIINTGVKVLIFGGDYPWSEEPGTSVLCCADGLRPVVFKIQRI
jgi:uncharacterized repeat protein (TIGR04076 family)